ncbi:arabinan endo-1,5-alpha-L-arabinosidase [Thermophagus sp. OGC60D27]|uniref:arabinan endo-1,5-alpha-L-arabinosidase n=1 Tax=Thermophagus sp. OGC60D27 TaxID=3458415 RepID=UPI004038242E
MKLSSFINSTFPLIIIALMSGCISDTKPNKKSLASGQNPYNDDYSQYTSLSHRHMWGTYNVHDPSIIKSGDTYYMYSTDAIFKPMGVKFNDDTIQPGNIQIRSSHDLINWKFEGWALTEIPKEAVMHVRNNNHGKGATNMWAPHVKKVGHEFRMYYSVSAFGTNSSFIGLATSTHPLGPWKNKGCVVKTIPVNKMNAIDPSVITDVKNGRMWMHYGSYFGGLYCVELDPQTGFTMKKEDHGHLVASRANLKTHNLEAPEIIYNPKQEKYYLFVSYDALFTYYNVRVGRADQPQGPFYDYFGNDMKDTTDNFPVLTHSYQFGNHKGWSGNGHCGILNDDGKYYMVHQGRLAPSNLMMLLHVRELFWLPDGWPVVSPERYAGVKKSQITARDIPGQWEIIQMEEKAPLSELWQGQIPPGGWKYTSKAFNVADTVQFLANGSTNSHFSKSWKIKNNLLYINNYPHVVFKGWDWENKNYTILFSGISENGFSFWGKKIN